jgi:Transglycosylase-like domain
MRSKHTRLLLAALTASVMLVPIARVEGMATAEEPRITAKEAKKRCLQNKRCRAKRASVHRHYKFCNTWRCVRLHDRMAARRYTQMRKRVTRPYRGWLASTRYCESGHHGLYRANTGNGFYGAYQFVLSTWYSVGGRGMPHMAEPLEQDYRAVLLLKRSGSGQWPVCG